MPPVDRKRMIACINGCAGLNPAAYRDCVKALQAALPYVLHDFRPEEGIQKQMAVVHQIQAALANSQEEHSNE